MRKIGSVLRSRQATIVGLSEVPWTRDEFRRQAAQWGYKHAILLRSHYRFNLGLMSLTPLKRVAASEAKPFFHGFLCAHVQTAVGGLGADAGLVVCVTHLTPRSPVERMAEVRALLPLIDAAAAATSAATSTSLLPVLLLGGMCARLEPRL